MYPFGCILEPHEAAVLTMRQPRRVSSPSIVYVCQLTVFRMYHANAGLNIITDLLVAVLPVKAIWKLQIQMRQKVALLFILTIGWL